MHEEQGGKSTEMWKEPQRRGCRGGDPFSPGISLSQLSGPSPTTPPPVSWGKQPRQGTGQRTHSRLVEQELGLSDVGQGWLWFGTHEHQVGEEPDKAELHPHPTREGHRSARQLWKGNSSRINSSEGPVSTFLHSRVPEGHRHTQALLPTPCMAHLGRVPRAQWLLPRDRWGPSGTEVPLECA